jgi:hypothetical protein
VNSRSASSCADRSAACWPRLPGRDPGACRTYAGPPAGSARWSSAGARRPTAVCAPPARRHRRVAFRARAGPASVRDGVSGTSACVHRKRPGDSSATAPGPARLDASSTTWRVADDGRNTARSNDRPATRPAGVSNADRLAGERPPVAARTTSRTRAHHPASGALVSRQRTLAHQHRTST